MKWTSIVTAFAVLFACVAGCTSTGTGQSGDKKIKVSVPGTLSVKQGESEKLKVSITRTKFEGAVTVKLDVPAELKVEDKEIKFDKNDKEKEIKVTGGDKDGTYTIKVSANGEGVQTDNAETKVTVTKKD